MLCEFEVYCNYMDLACHVYTVDLGGEDSRFRFGITYKVIYDEHNFHGIYDTA
jgi:hypothetical protein